MSAAVADAIAEQIMRLRVLWPVLNSRTEHTQEIVRALDRHAQRLTCEDVQVGFSDAIENTPTNSWPPGPHEVLGCVLQAARNRRERIAPQRRPHTGGLTFVQWWYSLPHTERPKHAALYRLMSGGEEPQAQPESVPPLSVVASDGDIDWSEAA